MNSQTPLNLSERNSTQLCDFGSTKQGWFYVFAGFKVFTDGNADLSTKEVVRLMRWQAGKNREGILPPPAGNESQSF